MAIREGAERLINKRRSEIQIVNEILKIGEGGVNATKIIYQTNLSHRQWQRYLAFLSKYGLLKKENHKSSVEAKRRNNGEKILYFTTKKGKKFLALTEEINSLLDLDQMT